MVDLHRRLTVAALISAILVGACGKSEAPPPPKVEAVAVAPTVNEDIKRSAMDVYVYALPLVLMDVARQVQTARTPANTFQHRHLSPDSTASELIHPNPDVVYSEAWLDLAHEPIVLSLPDTHGRYYSMPMLDAWTNVFQSPGKRQSGTQKADFAIVGPKWKGELPADVEAIKAPTEMVWLLGPSRGDQETGHRRRPAFRPEQARCRVGEGCRGRGEGRARRHRRRDQGQHRRPA